MIGFNDKVRDILEQRSAGRQALQESWDRFFTAALQSGLAALALQVDYWIAMGRPTPTSDSGLLIELAVLMLLFGAALYLVWRMFVNLAESWQLRGMGHALLDRKGGLLQAIVVVIVGALVTVYLTRHPQAVDTASAYWELAKTYLR